MWHCSLGRRTDTTEATNGKRDSNLVKYVLFVSKIPVEQNIWLDHCRVSNIWILGLVLTFCLLAFELLCVVQLTGTIQRYNRGNVRKAGLENFSNMYYLPWLDHNNHKYGYHSVGSHLSLSLWILTVCFLTSKLLRVALITGTMQWHKLGGDRKKGLIPFQNCIICLDWPSRSKDKVRRIMKCRLFQSKLAALLGIFMTLKTSYVPPYKGVLHRFTTDT